MTPLKTVAFDLPRCLREVADFEQLLATNSELSERRDILPFFRRRPQLSVMCGIAVLGLGVPFNRIAWEYDLFGDYRCDLVVGVLGQCFCLIEFEDASPTSIFIPGRGRATPEWSTRFERGTSQIVDWFHKLSDMATTADFAARFGNRSINFEGVLIIGRTRDLQPAELNRLEWRRQKARVDSRAIHCITYDILLERCKDRLDLIQPRT